MKFFVFHRNGEHHTLRLVVKIEADNAEDAMRKAIPLDKEIASQVVEHCDEVDEGMDYIFNGTEGEGRDLPIVPGEGPFGWFTDRPPIEKARSTWNIGYADFLIAIEEDTFCTQCNLMIKTEMRIVEEGDRFTYLPANGGNEK